MSNHRSARGLQVDSSRARLRHVDIPGLAARIGDQPRMSEVGRLIDRPAGLERLVELTIAAEIDPVDIDRLASPVDERYERRCITVERPHGLARVRLGLMEI